MRERRARREGAAIVIAPMPDGSADTTDDTVLGGRLLIRQPRRGHRVGHDAILLAAATPAVNIAVELGAGVGAAGLALALREPGVRLWLVEIEPSLAALAAHNAAVNGLGERIRMVTADVRTSLPALAAVGVAAGTADAVLMNPPFNAERLQPSADPLRRRAHLAAPDTLPVWLGAARDLLRPDGVVTLIWRADGLGDVLGLLPELGFGGVAVMPVHPRPDAGAIRVLVRAVRGSRTPLGLLPPLVLNDSDGRPSVAAEAVLRHARPLPFGRDGAV